jgi:hypothetical protein
MRRALLTLVFATTALAGDSTPDLRIDTHDVEGTALREARVTVRAAASPAAILSVLWRHEEHPRILPRVRRLDILRDDGDERLIYQQIAVPIGKDRDIVLRVRRTTDAGSGIIDVRSQTVTGEGPPESAQLVRVRESAGHWHLVPAPGGGTDVTYTIRTDAGEGLVRWISGRAQRGAVADLVHAVLEQARRDETERAP